MLSAVYKLECEVEAFRNTYQKVITEVGDRIRVQFPVHDIYPGV